MPTRSFIFIKKKGTGYFFGKKSSLSPFSSRFYFCDLFDIIPAKMKRVLFFTPAVLYYALIFFLSSKSYEVDVDIPFLDKGIHVVLKSLY